MNHHSGYQTGCSSEKPNEVSSSTCTNTYDIEESGTGASTTGTIYGVYDMNGGAWDQVMGNFKRISGYTSIEYTSEQAASILGRVDGISVGIWNSGFHGPVYGKALDGVTSLESQDGIPFPKGKYYDFYATEDKNTACNGTKCLGDGTQKRLAGIRIIIILSRFLPHGSFEVVIKMIT